MLSRYVCTGTNFRGQIRLKGPSKSPVPGFDDSGTETFAERGFSEMYRVQTLCDAMECSEIGLTDGFGLD